MSNPIDTMVKQATHNAENAGKAIAKGTNHVDAAIRHQTKKTGTAIWKNMKDAGKAAKKSAEHTVKAAKNGSKAVIKKMRTVGKKMDKATGIKDRKKREKCHTIIHAASATTATSSAALAQVLGAGEAAELPVQTTMIKALGQVFGIDVDAKKAVHMVGKDLLSKGFKVLKYGTKALELAPVAGNIIGGASSALSTESIGWSAARKFQRQAERKRR